MKNAKLEKGSISVFVIVAFIFCMTILMNIYWSTSNYQVSVLQAQQRIQDVYGEDVNRMNEIHEAILATTSTPEPTPIPEVPPTFTIASSISETTEVQKDASYYIASSDVANINSTSTTTLEVSVNGTKVTLPYVLPTDKIENYTIKYTVRNNAGETSKERTVKVYKNCTLTNIIKNRRSRK